LFEGRLQLFEALVEIGLTPCQLFEAIGNFLRFLLRLVALGKLVFLRLGRALRLETIFVVGQFELIELSL
jgi:hypothetical protein